MLACDEFIVFFKCQKAVADVSAFGESPFYVPKDLRHLCAHFSVLSGFVYHCSNNAQFHVDGGGEGAARKGEVRKV